MLGDGLRWVIEACRTADPDAAITAIAIGERTPTEQFDAAVPADVRAALQAEGWLTVDGDESRLGVACQSLNGLVSLAPSGQTYDADYVHINADTLWLLQLAWQYGSPGDAAAELGAGNAIVAAFLVARYQRVIATDLPGPWVDYGALTLEANAGRGRPSGMACMDVAGALRPGVFDLVVSNTPWSPGFPPDEQGRPVVFADGGPTGTELPSRFLLEGAELLAPGGVAITLCFDPVFDDGFRPLEATLDKLSGDGFDLELVDSLLFPTELVTEKLRASRLPDLAEGRHIAVVCRRAA